MIWRRVLHTLIRGFYCFIWTLARGGVLRPVGARVLVVTPDWYMRAINITDEPVVVRCHAIVRGVVRGEDIVWARRIPEDADKTRKRSTNTEAFRFADRGVTWCYGWRDEDAKVLHALVALENAR